jgi:hypothetical protein
MTGSVFRIELRLAARRCRNRRLAWTDAYRGHHRRPAIILMGAAGTTTTISFTSLTNFGCGGILIDNVSVEFVGPPLSTTKDECKGGGWQSFGVFKNQGDCVSFVATQGENGPAGG